jgi:hypothetical protein
LNASLTFARCLPSRRRSYASSEPNSYLKQTREMYRNLPSHKQYLIAEVLESNDPQNITEEPDTIRYEIIVKTWVNTPLRGQV